MDQEILKEKVRNSLREFRHEKPYLYKIGIYEPTISHRIALYLEKEFRGESYFVDCEYSKNLGKKKMSDDGVHIRPDIIVHKRDSELDNLIIIELKKGCSKDSVRAKQDIEKLQKTENLSYALRVFLGITRNKTDIVWVDSFGTVEEVLED